MQNDISDLISRIERIEQRLTEESDRYTSVNTEVDALEQSLKAVQEAQENRKKIRDLGHLYHDLNRKLNAIACCTIGSFFIWQSSGMQVDQTLGNDRLAEWLAIAGLVIVSFGILVLTGKEDRAIAILQSMNPWKRNND